MYFLMIRPQRRRMREQQALQSSLEVGDEVITNSGIYGFITGFDGDVLLARRSTTTCRSASHRAAIQGKVDTTGPSAERPAVASERRRRRRRTTPTARPATTDDDADPTHTRDE